MKRGTPKHPKTRRLARELGIPVYAAVGLLEMLWHFAAEYTPQGNIGRYPAAEIADAIGWAGDAETLIAGLLASEYLDRDDEHIFLVHDFHDHADEAVKKRLLRNGLEFLTKPRRATSRRSRDTSRRDPDASRQNLDTSSLAGGTGEGEGEALAPEGGAGETAALRLHQALVADTVWPTPRHRHLAEANVRAHEIWEAAPFGGPIDGLKMGRVLDSLRAAGQPSATIFATLWSYVETVDPHYAGIEHFASKFKLFMPGASASEKGHDHARRPPRPAGRTAASQSQDWSGETDRDGAPRRAAAAGGTNA